MRKTSQVLAKLSTTHTKYKSTPVLLVVAYVPYKSGGRPRGGHASGNEVDKTAGITKTWRKTYGYVFSQVNAPDE